MLASMISQHHQKILLFVDRVGVEEACWKRLMQVLLEDLKAQTILENFLEISNHLTDERKSMNFHELLKFPEETVSIVFSPVADIVKQYEVEDFFRIIQKLRWCPQVRHIVLFAQEKYIEGNFVVPFLEHLAEEIVTLDGKSELKIVSRKAGGSVTKKCYNFRIEENRIVTAAMSRENTPKTLDNTLDIDNLGTFKIGLSDQDLVARNRLILPFEKHMLEQKSTEKQDAKVIYYPEADDDIDEEDPDFEL
ncbi:elongator complex protein 5 [Phlebotomus argentipes]|uniref:elongator complex protein 5 n=1 Tax=Phlebotomus argentipes TaxID=94469 RepID=UPI002893505D|nr:elongator complex protein 5 [Phlebotomus argentipes]